MKIKNFLPIFILILLIITLPLAVFLIKQRWAPEKAVELPSPIILSPTTGEFPVGQTFTINLMINTENQSVDGLDLVMAAHNLEMEVETIPLPEGLSYQKKPEIFKNTLKMSILAEPGHHFANNEPQALINLRLHGRVFCQNAGLTIDKNFSVVASGGQNIIGEPVEPSFVVQTPEGIVNPQFTSPDSAEAVLGQNFSYITSATNPNNGNLQFSFYNLPDFLTASGPVLEGMPDQTGEYEIDIEVVDSQGGSACTTLKLIVFDLALTPTPTPIIPTPTIPPDKSLNIKFQFQGKKENQNNHLATIWAKGTGFKKTFTGNPDGTYSFNIKSELANRDEPYEILIKGYQNLAVKRTIAIRDGANPSSGYLDFGQLSCGDIAPAGNPDNMVNSLDWGYMVDEWNLEKEKESVADINNDNRVNSLDYSLLISRFGLKGEE